MFGRMCGCMFGFVLRIVSAMALLSVFLAFYPSLPQEGTFVKYKHLLQPDVKLEPNTALNSAERLFDGQLPCPEALVVYNGVLYTGLHGGHVVKVLPDKIEKFLKIGKACAGIHDERSCGRTLGLRVKNDIMYIADAYFGIFEHELTNESSKPNQLVGPNLKVNGKPAKIFNALEVDADNNIYFTSSSSEYDLTDGLHSVLTSGTGRLLKFDSKTREVSELLNLLHLPNGLAFSGDGRYIFVAESSARRILKYNIVTSKKDVFLDGLPGFPDNIQYAGENTYWVTLVFPAGDEVPSFLEAFADYPQVRRFISRALVLAEWPFTIINQYYPNKYSEMAAYYIGSLAPIMALIPERVTIVRFDGTTGKVIESLRGDNAVLSIVSDVAVVGDYMYLGSTYNNFIGRLTLNGDLKGKYAQTELATEEVYAQLNASVRKSTDDNLKPGNLEAGNKMVPEQDLKEKKVSVEGNKPKVQDDRMKTEL